MENISEIGLKVLEHRYLLKDIEGKIIETPDELFWRVARSVAKGDRDKASRYHKMMASFDFLPNSPTLMNAGTELGMLSACFVIPIPDSITGIMDAAKTQALVQKSGGGTGFSFSRLRPTGDIVKKTSGISSGPLSFMEVFNATTETIKQGGKRRGANMAILRVDHPDIMEFITCKSSGDKFNNFNISVGITDKFMWAVQKNCEYDLINPRTKKVVGSLKAKKVFNAIAEEAWRTGDPGVVFLDLINVYTDLSEYGEIEATNPCVVGETPILTKNGYKPIKTLVDQPTTMWNGFEWATVIPKITGTNQKIMDIEFSDGSIISCTPYHKFHIVDPLFRYNNPKTIIVEAQNLKVHDKIIRFELPTIEGNIEDTHAYTRGFFCGDGSSETNRERYFIWLYGHKKKLIKYLKFEAVTECKRDRIFVKLYGHYKYSKTFVPNTAYTIHSRLNWLAGLIDSDGTINDFNGSIAIHSIDKNFLYKTKLMLCTMGIHSTLALSKKAGNKSMPDGRGGVKQYATKPCYRLTISASNVNQLLDLGLKTHRVQPIVNINRSSMRYIKVINKTPRKKKEEFVYCFTEPKNHTGLFGSIITGQCGEQPLLPFESCNLGSINLSNFVEIISKKINYERLRTTVEEAVDFLNGVIDTNNYLTKSIKEASERMRKIGLGVMGFADMLAMMGIPYNSDHAVKGVGDLMSFIQNAAIKRSEELAKKDGPFPAYDKEKCDFPSRRNATLTTIAPTGSISMIAGCSSGIEPYFALAYKRKNILDNSEFVEFCPTLKGKLKSLDLYNEKIINKIVKTGSIQTINEVPDKIKRIFLTAHEIDPMHHIKIQKEVQIYTCNAVSKTINLSAEATIEDIQKIYMEAWVNRCKGVTIYRDKSRVEQVMTKGTEKKMTEKKEPIAKHEPRKRPKRLSGFTEKIETSCGTLYVTINWGEDNRPFEVFTRIGKAGGCASSQSEALGRLISMALRSGIQPKYIVKQLRGITCHLPRGMGKKKVSSCADAAAQVLENVFMKKENPQQMFVRGACPECQGPIEYEGGCSVCKQCGFSDCG